MINPLVGMPQGLEWLVILAIVVLVFGAAKLPDLARGTGQALRIFKAETKGLRDDDKSADDTDDTTDTDAKAREPRGITSGDHLSSSQPVDDPAKRASDN